MWRKNLVTHSKFRNVYGEPYRKDKCYENVKFTKNAWDGTYCAVNSKFLAVVLDTSRAGGAFLVIPLEKVGHQPLTNPRVVGHQREVLDIQWNPFNDHIIASGSEDGTVKIWRIPSGGLTEDLMDPLVDLRGHQRKVGLIRWHPTANGIIASAAFDFKVIIWNALKAKALCTIDCHKDTIFDLAFNFNGSKLATTSKDKKIRVIEARTGKLLQQFNGHASPKTSHVAFTDEISDYIVTSGCNSSSSREISLWDLNQTSSPVKTDVIDSSSSILMLHYDMDLKIAYVAGKGDGLIRYYEVRREEPFLLRLSEYRNSSPQKSLGKMGKRGLDFGRCEIFRFYKLHPNNWIEVLPMYCPRRSDEFQEDLYPPSPSMQPALTADEWVSGIDKNPNMISFKDGQQLGDVVGTTSPSGTSTAEKFSSMFNRPDDQTAKGEMSVSIDYSSPSSNDILSKSDSAHSSNDGAFMKLQQRCDEQEREIARLKGTLSQRDDRIHKLERELASKDSEISRKKDEFRREREQLVKENQILNSRLQAKERGDMTVVKSSEASVESIPHRPKHLVQESITSSVKHKMSLEDHGIHHVLDDAHKEPMVGFHDDRNGIKDMEISPSLGKQSSHGEYRLEDIEAELEMLHDELAQTREIRQSKRN